MTSKRHVALRRAGVIALAAAVALSAGCRGDRTDKPPRQFFPGLDDQPKYKSQSASNFFADGRTMREPPPGVVAFSRQTELSFGVAGEEDWPAIQTAQRTLTRQRGELLRVSDGADTGQDADGAWLERIPVRAALGYEEGETIDAAAMRRFLEVGRERYNIFCAVCHGYDGEGLGSVGRLWVGGVSRNLLTEQYLPGGELGQDGYIFNVVRNGVANPPGTLPALRMPGYGEKLDRYESWAVVAYLRALQRAQGTDANELPADDRNRLAASRQPSTPSGAVASTGQAPSGEDSQ